jgi:opine dehydrogenase
MGGNIHIAVLGGGQAAFAHAADLSIRGFKVSLFELPEMADTIAEVKTNGGIELKADPSTGLRGGFGKVDTVTSDAGEALDGADVAFVVVPAFAQEAFAAEIAPHVKKEQIVVLSPGSFWGAIVER